MKKSLISLIIVIQIVGFQIQLPLVSAQDDTEELDPTDLAELQELRAEQERAETCEARSLPDLDLGSIDFEDDSSPQDQSAGAPLSPAERRKQILAEHAKQQEHDCLRIREGQAISVIEGLLRIIANYERESRPPTDLIKNLVRGEPQGNSPKRPLSLQEAVRNLQKIQEEIARFGPPQQLSPLTKARLQFHGLLTDLTYQTPPPPPTN